MKDKAKERLTKRNKFAYFNMCHESERGICKDLIAMCDSGRMIVCREADRQWPANWSISVWDLGPVLWWLQLLTPCGAADTWLNLQSSTIMQSLHSYGNPFVPEYQWTEMKKQTRLGQSLVYGWAARYLFAFLLLSAFTQWYNKSYNTAEFPIKLFSSIYFSVSRSDWNGPLREHVNPRSLSSHFQAAALYC